MTTETEAVQATETSQQPSALWASELTFNCDEGRARLLAWLTENPDAAKTSRQWASVVFGSGALADQPPGAFRARQHQVKDALDWLAGKRTLKGGEKIFDATLAAIERVKDGRRVSFKAKPLGGVIDGA